MSDKSLAGKTALITGGSRGLGRAMAVALGGAGAHVILVARDGLKLAESVEAVQAAGGTAEVFPADVTQEIEVTALAQTVQARHGKLHILINNAGINIRKPLTEFTLEEWHRIMDTNLTSVFLLCRALVPLMRGNNYGRIINMTSIMSHVALPGRAPYATTKAGLLGFTRALAQELASEKITVNGISPGPFGTEMNTPVMQNPETNREFISRIPLGRWGQVEEVGQLALYLCSEGAGFVTGTDIVIDGGWCAQ